MRHESKFAAWIRSGSNSVFVLPMGSAKVPEVKFSVVPDRLLDSIIDDALAEGVARLNGFLPEGVSIDITSVDPKAIKGQLRTSVVDRLNETGVPVNPNRAAADSMTAIINRGADSYGQRWENVRRLSESEVFANACRFSVSRPRFEDTE